MNRTYYYIEFRSTIDGIKYRVYRLAELVRRSVNNGADSKGYVCPHCSKRFALLEALSLDTDEQGVFCCDRCQHTLIEDEESAETKLGHEKIQRMNRQIEKIERFLREVDTVQIPLNDFDTAISNSVPVPRVGLSAAQFVPMSTRADGSVAHRNAQHAIEISITSSSEKSADELRAEQLRRQQQADKNALPVWHTQSTVVPGQATNAGIKEEAERAARLRDGIGLARREAEAAAEEKVAAASMTSGGGGGGGGDAIAEYYAALAAQKAQEEAEEREEDEDSEDEDEEDEDEEDEEFEDLLRNDEAPTVKKARIEPPPPPKVELKKEIEEDSDEEVDFEDV